jgi:hypothetical protein
MQTCTEQSRSRDKGAKILRRALPGLLLGGLVLLFFNKMAFSNLILARGDTFLYFYPYWNAAAEALRAGRTPLWNDSLFMGAPLLANSQVGFFYPLNWPVWWLLPTPYAVSASILIHVLIAGTGAYLLGKRALFLEWRAALLTAVLFALGGYFTAQVEHINQVQGLAWLPWLLWAVTPLPGKGTRIQADAGWRWILGRGTAVALFFSLQLSAGHAQTTFISGVAAGVWVAVEGLKIKGLKIKDQRLKSEDWRANNLHSSIFNLFTHLAPIFFAALLALLITAVQLLPTLELSSYSARQGGLPPNEVLSFSLNPLLLGRALLPQYGQSLFSEYVAFLPIVALAAAVVGAWQWRRWDGVFPALVLALLGLFLAFGVFNPVYWLLARLPGFDLFRVPARWLALYALGAALLAGAGFQLLWNRYRILPGSHSSRITHHASRIKRPLRIAIFLILSLIAWNAAAGLLARFLPIGPEAPYETPNAITLLLWLLEILAVYLVVGGVGLGRKRTAVGGLALLALAVLFLASRSLPYNHLTTPEAWFDLRPPAARLLIDDSVPHGRLLSLSNIFFDPGDQGEIASIYAGQLDEAALYDYTVAIKQKEIIAPNLPLAYGLASVDGFDGGILPLAAYSQLMRLILPDGQTTSDGRLREHLQAVPEAKWLDLFNGRYLITDKTADQWRTLPEARMDVFFDLQHALPIEPTAAIAWLPDFPAGGLALLSEGEPGRVVVDGAEADLLAQDGELSVWRLPEAGRVESLSFTAVSPGWRILGATLLNEESGAFMPLTLGNYRLIHSGDVKIYENLDVLPRAFFAAEWTAVATEAEALALMQQPDFDPGREIVLMGGVSGGSSSEQTGAAEIVAYAPERVVIRTQSEAAGMLLLTDANYPGWRAAVDGEPVPIYTADLLFRSVLVPAGEHEVVFEFESAAYGNGRLLTLFGLMLLLILVFRRFSRSKFYIFDPQINADYAD